jgi:hypothetical protein
MIAEIEELELEYLFKYVFRKENIVYAILFSFFLKLYSSFKNIS